MRNGAAAPAREVVDTPVDMLAGAEPLEVIRDIEADDEPDEEAEAEADADDTPPAVCETVKMADDAKVEHWLVAGMKMDWPAELAAMFWAGGSLGEVRVDRVEPDVLVVAEAALERCSDGAVTRDRSAAYSMTSKTHLSGTFCGGQRVSWNKRIAHHVAAFAPSAAFVRRSDAPTVSKMLSHRFWRESVAWDGLQTLRQIWVRANVSRRSATRSRLITDELVPVERQRTQRDDRQTIPELASRRSSSR